MAEALRKAMSMNPYLRVHVHHESLLKLRTELAKFVQDGTAG
jgi:hypothetical protein